MAENRKLDFVEKLYSPEAEAAVLGSMLLEPTIIPEVLSKLPDSEAFFMPENQIIYDALLKLHLDNKPIDAVMLRTELTEWGNLDKVGGYDYIEKILNSVPSAANVSHYAETVREKIKHRRLILIGERIQKEIDSTGSTEERVFKIQQIVSGLDGALEPVNGSRPIIKNLADVKALPINYLWFNKIPMGMLTLIQGDAGLGKSFLTLYLVSKVSTGESWPDGDGLPDNNAPKGSVIILSAEDDLEHIIRPRLDSLKADVSKIISLEGVKIRDEGGEYQGYFNLQSDIRALEQAIKSCKDCKLVIIDPLTAYLGGKIDSHRDSDVRSVLSPLVELAEKNQVAVIGVMHLNKNANNKAIYRGMGSIAFTAAARTVWMVSRDPDYPESKRRLLTPIKHNVLIEPTGLAFEINNGRVIFEDEPLNISADEALGQGSIVEAPLLEKAKQWLAEQLPVGKSVATKELSEWAKLEGITESTLRRAKRELKVASFPCQVGGKQVWFVKEGSQQDDTQV